VSVIAALQKMRAAGGGGAGVVGLPVELVGGLVVSGSRCVLIVCVDRGGVWCVSWCGYQVRDRRRVGFGGSLLPRALLHP
jgi:hypothetical protein